MESLKYYYNLLQDVRHNMDKIKEFNKELVKEYPFLHPYKASNSMIEEFDNYEYDYSFTMIDLIEPGWMYAFGDDLLKELKEELLRVNFLDDYTVFQIKEKFGRLRWYGSGYPQDSKVDEIISKYEEMSYDICGKCGNHATYTSIGWIYPYCEKCARKKYEEAKKDFEEYFEEPYLFTFENQYRKREEKE